MHPSNLLTFARAAVAPRTISVPASRSTAIGLGFEALTLATAALILASMLIDAIGQPLRIVAVGLVALLIVVPLAIGLVAQLRGWRPANLPIELALLVVIGVITQQVIAPALPALLPIGSSVDAVHHTALAAYIFDHHELVRDSAAAAPLLGEMAAYPPGFAILAALGAEIWQSRPVTVIFPLAALCVVMSGLGVALLASEASQRSTAPIVALSGLAILLMPEYSLGIVADQNYYAQALAQWLIIAVGYMLARMPRITIGGALRPGVLLLALAFTYTTWLPIGLLTVVVALIVRNEAWMRRIGAIAAISVPPALIALVYGWSRAATGTDVALHEGSTIRDPLAVTGLILPALALIGLLRGWRSTERRAGLALIVAVLLVMSGFGVLWQQERIAGYIFYKVLYLLALLLVVPIGWLLADLLIPLARRPNLLGGTTIVSAAGIVVLALSNPGLSSARSEGAHPISIPLIDTARWIDERDLGDGMAYALTQPGLSAYWVHVGLLEQPRTDAAHTLLEEPPLRFMEWYLDPTMPPRLLLEQPAPPQRDGLAVLYANACCTVLEKTADYGAAMERLQPLLVSFRATQPDIVHVDLQVFDQRSQPDLSVELAIMRGDQPIDALRVPVPQRVGRVQYLGFTFNPRSLVATSYANHESGQKLLAVDPAADSRIAVRLLRRDDVVQQQIVGECTGGQCTVVQPSGAWSYVTPQLHDQRLTEQSLGLGDAIDLIGSHVELVDRSKMRVDLRWRASQMIDQRYVAFVHLVAANGGTAWSQDGEPNGGMTPTWRWHSGMTIDDQRMIDLPNTLEPGTYQVTVGMYDPASGARLPAWRRAPSVERFWSDELTLGTITIAP